MVLSLIHAILHSFQFYDLKENKSFYSQRTIHQHNKWISSIIFWDSSLRNSYCAYRAVDFN